MKKLFFFPVAIAINILLSHSICNAQSGIITTVIGTGVAGFSGDGGPGIDAKINETNAIYTTPEGLVYISDAYNERIRELKDFGTIVTIAGDSIGGYNGDSIVATSAELYQPGGVVSDAAGNVYIGDYYNNRIRKIDGSTGLISTIAGTGVAGYGGDGGPATAALFNWPYNVSLDGHQNLYVADQYNHRIRKINLVTGIITTVAGTGTPGSTGDGGPATTAEIYFPNYIHSDPAGNLYITDNGNHKIRKVDTLGIINTIVGTGVGGYSGDGGPATAAQLYYPAGVKLDTAGNLYIADNANNVIRKVNTSGVISTIAGNNVAGYSGDGGPATDAELNGPLDVSTDYMGNIYIVDCLNNRVRKITPAPTSASKITTTTDFKLFPNPNNGVFSINIPDAGAAALTITDISGQVLFSKRWVNAGNKNETLSLGNMQPGIYFVKINCNENAYLGNVMIW